MKITQTFAEVKWI